MRHHLKRAKASTVEGERPEEGLSSTMVGKKGGSDMKKLFCLAGLGIVLAAAPPCVCAARGEVALEAKPGIAVAEIEPVEFPFNFRVQYWHSDGTAMFRNAGFDPDFGPWESQLEYPMDGDFMLFGAEYAFRALGSRVSVDLNYGFSENIGGTTRDWDWGWYEPEPLIYAETDTDGDSDFVTGNVYYRLWEWGRRNSIDAFLGYHGQENSFTNCDVRVLVPEYFTAPGKVAEYEMDFDGVRAGLRTNAAVAPRLSLRGNLGFIPYASFDASGKWLLRDLYISQSGDGWGVDFDVYLDFEVTRNIALFAGLKYLYLCATHGEESVISEGVPYGPYDVLDKAKSDQFGGSAGVTAKF